MSIKLVTILEEIKSLDNMIKNYAGKPIYMTKYIPKTPQDHYKLIFIDDLLELGWKGSGFEKRKKKYGCVNIEYDYSGHTSLWFDHSKLPNIKLRFDGSNTVTINHKRKEKRHSDNIIVIDGYKNYNKIFGNITGKIDRLRNMDRNCAKTFLKLNMSEV
jgi:hypothetical protein